MKYIQYEHYSKNVWVREDLKGTHQNNCLCFACANFNPGMPETNCKIANLLYAVCLAHNLVTPVYECPKFEEK